MSDFAININQDQIKNLVSEGLLAQLTEEVRADILKQAISYLLTPPKGNSYNSYGTQLTPLQAAFNMAAESVVRDVVREMTIESEEFKTAVREGVADAVGVAAKDKFELQQKIGQAVGAVIAEGWSTRDY